MSSKFKATCIFRNVVRSWVKTLVSPMASILGFDWYMTHIACSSCWSSLTGKATRYLAGSKGQWALKGTSHKSAPAKTDLEKWATGLGIKKADLASRTFISWQQADADGECLNTKSTSEMEASSSM